MIFQHSAPLAPVLNVSCGKILRTCFKRSNFVVSQYLKKGAEMSESITLVKAAHTTNAHSALPARSMFGTAFKTLAFVGGFAAGAYASYKAIGALKNRARANSKNRSTNTSQINTMSENFQPAIIFRSDGTVTSGVTNMGAGAASYDGGSAPDGGSAVSGGNATDASYSCDAPPTCSSANITAEKIAQRANVNLRDCYQCGKCSAGCPMHEGMDLGPRQIMRKLQMGLVGDALHAKSPWICAQCMTCAYRCPQNIDICELMRAVRMTAHEAGIIASKESDVFESEFIKGVRQYGKNSESYLAAFYNLKSGHLAQDAFNAPKMLAKGLIGPKREKVRDRNGVRALVDRCLHKSRGAKSAGLAPHTSAAQTENIDDEHHTPSAAQLSADELTAASPNAGGER